MYVLKFKKSNFNIAFLCLVLTAFFIINSKQTSEYTYEGIKFALKYIISSVFPFIFLSRILIDTRALDKISEKFSPFLKKVKINPYITAPFLLSLLCGFPVGAIYINELYTKGTITKKEADILLPMCNNPSVAFVISTVGETFLHSQKKGAVLWVINTALSAIISLMFLPKLKKSTVKTTKAETSYSFAPSFVKSMEQSIKASFNIGATVTIFYLLCKTTFNILSKYITSNIACAFIISILEIGNGCFYSSAIGSFSSVLCAFAVGFSGICVFFQVNASAHTNSSMGFYLFSKAVCGLLCSFFAFFLL